MRTHRLAAVLAFAVLGAPPASAIVSEDVRWRREEGPVHVYSTLVIDAFGSLLIEPGVEVLFHERASLILRGPMTAAGTAGLPVRLMPLDPSAGWGGVRIEGGDARLDHVVIEGARTGLDAAGGSTTLSHARIERCGTLVAAEAPARLLIVDSELLGASGTGLSVGGGARVTASGLRLTACAVGADVAADGVLELGGSDVGRHSERALVVGRGARVSLLGCAVHDTPVAVETLEAEGLGMSGCAFACNGLDVVAATSATVAARGNFWGAPGRTSGPVDQALALTEPPEEMRDLERLIVSRDASGLRFEWASIADCGEHAVLWAPAPGAPLSDSPGEPRRLGDGRTVECFVLRTLSYGG